MCCSSLYWTAISLPTRPARQSFGDVSVRHFTLLHPSACRPLCMWRCSLQLFFYFAAVCFASSSMSRCLRSSDCLHWVDGFDGDCCLLCIFDGDSGEYDLIAGLLFANFRNAFIETHDKFDPVRFLIVLLHL